jgi:hypothetical protein
MNDAYFEELLADDGRLIQPHDRGHLSRLEAIDQALGECRDKDMAEQRDFSQLYLLG